MDEYVTKRAVQDLLAKYYATANIKQDHVLRHVNMDLKALPAEDVVPRCSGAGHGRLIDADRLKAHYSWWPENERTVLDQIVDAQPTVDAVPVVRCRECSVPHNRWTGCPKLGGLIPPDDFYCAFGERKDGADG
jgi:hypothetical protein